MPAALQDGVDAFNADELEAWVRRDRQTTFSATELKNKTGQVLEAVARPGTWPTRLAAASSLRADLRDG